MRVDLASSLNGWNGSAIRLKTRYCRSIIDRTHPTDYALCHPLYMSNMVSYPGLKDQKQRRKYFLSGIAVDHSLQGGTDRYTSYTGLDCPFHEISTQQQNDESFKSNMPAFLV